MVIRWEDLISKDSMVGAQDLHRAVSGLVHVYDVNQPVFAVFARTARLRY